MVRGRFSLRHGCLCIAVAVLLPAPAALASQPQPEILDSSSSLGTAVARAVPVVPVPADRPPVVTDAPKADRHQKAEQHKRDHRKKRAVIKTTQHERIEQISANTSYDVPLAALTAYRNAANRV